MSDHTPVVILISGFARAGKDTLADAIVERVKRDQPFAAAHKRPFARALKDAADHYLDQLNLFGVSFHDEAFKNKHRAALVEMGRVARSVDLDVFARKTAEDIANDHAEDCIDTEGPFVYVIPDWRYLNEVKVVREQLNYIHSTEDYKVVTVRVDTKGVLPANEEELHSLAEIRRSMHTDWEFEFEPDGRDGIEAAAELLCRRLGLLP